MELAEMLPLLARRESTMRAALDLLTERRGRQIIETGCARVPDNWSGDGMSTLVFAAWAAENRGDLISIDNDPEHLFTCREMLTHPANLILSDSIAWLAAYAGPIDLLYLDSFDYPHGALLDLYGGREDLEKAIATLAALSEAEIVERHGDVIGPSQEHCRAELAQALPHLHQNSLVLIDDADLPGGGKARLAKELLEGYGWQCVAEDYQTLWKKAEREFLG